MTNRRLKTLGLMLSLTKLYHADLTSTRTAQETASPVLVVVVMGVIEPIHVACALTTYAINVTTCL